MKEALGVVEEIAGFKAYLTDRLHDAEKELMAQLDDLSTASAK